MLVAVAVAVAVEIEYINGDSNGNTIIVEARNAVTVG